MISDRKVKDIRQRQRLWWGQSQRRKQCSRLKNYLSSEVLVLAEHAFVAVQLWSKLLQGCLDPLFVGLLLGKGAASESVLGYRSTSLRLTA